MPEEKLEAGMLKEEAPLVPVVQEAVAGGAAAPQELELAG